jgi:hypothetical protein
MALSQLQIEKQKALLDIMGPKISEEEIKKYNLVQKNKENLIKFTNIKNTELTKFRNIVENYNNKIYSINSKDINNKSNYENA